MLGELDPKFRPATRTPLAPEELLCVLLLVEVPTTASPSSIISGFLDEHVIFMMSSALVRARGSLGGLRVTIPPFPGLDCTARAVVISIFTQLANMLIMLIKTTFIAEIPFLYKPQIFDDHEHIFRGSAWLFQMWIIVSLLFGFVRSRGIRTLNRFCYV